MTRWTGRAMTGAVIARLGVHLLESHPPQGRAAWQRRNFRGAQVTLLAGPALAVAVSATGPGAAGALAGLGAGIAGGYDDLAGEAGEAKGFGGHVSALRRGRLTSGAAKLLAISAASGLAAACVRPRRDVLLNGAVIAGSANLVNLLDLRPGRALKAGLAAGTVLGQPGVVGACAALLPGDLAERRMLGDCGANALGAVLGVALVRRLRPRATRWVALGTLVVLTAVSERVSFSAVIDRTPTLRRIDRLGRLP